MKSHHYRVTLEHVAGKSPDAPLHPPLQFTCQNHDDVFDILARAQTARLFDEEETLAFALGLKLFSEVMLAHRNDPVFAPLQPAFGEFMKTLKARTGAKPASDKHLP